MAINGTDVILFIQNTRLGKQTSLEIQNKDGVKTFIVEGLLSDKNNSCFDIPKETTFLKYYFDLFKEGLDIEVKYKDRFTFMVKSKLISSSFHFATEETAYYKLVIKEVVVDV